VEVDDIHKMDMSRSGVLELRTNVQKATPSAHFNYFASRIQERWNMKSEISRRTLIDLFLLEAFGELQPDDENIMYPELEVKPVTAGSIKLHGHIDYVVAKSATKNVGARKAALSQGSDLPSNVFLTTLEAKKDESFAAGVGQTMAEMKALWALNEEKRDILGILSDGFRWLFLVLHKDGKKCYLTSDYFNYPKQTDEILTILKQFVRGECTVFEEK
jgi:hypothetical protein